MGLFGAFRNLLDSLYQYPGGWLADRVGRRRALLGAFVIGGLKEIGEPARKSLIVDLAPDVQRAWSVVLRPLLRAV